MTLPGLARFPLGSSPSAAALEQSGFLPLSRDSISTLYSLLMDETLHDPTEVYYSTILPVIEDM